MPDKLPGFADLADLPEDKRIEIIGKFVTEQKKIVGVALDDDKKKVDRYISKMLIRFPGLVIESKTKLMAGTVLVRVGPKPTPRPESPAPADPARPS